MISIIIPIFNQEKYIDKCLLSLLQQTYTDLQIILVDDGSTDSSVQICERYLADERIKLVNQPNSGVSAARNRGLKEVLGEWVSFIDPDDYVVENYFEKLINEAYEDVDLIACCCKAFDDGGFYDSFFFEESFEIDSDVGKKELYLQLMNGQYRQPQKAFTAIGVPWGKLYRTSVIVNNNLIFNEKIKRQQDNIFNMHFFDRAKKIKYINEPLYLYCLDNVKNYYNNRYDKSAFAYFLEFQKERILFLRDKNLLSEEGIQDAYCNECLSNMIKILNYQYLNENNTDSIANRYLGIKDMLEEEVFSNVLKNAQLRHINGKMHKLIFLFMRYRWIKGLHIAWKLKRLYLLSKKKWCQ